VCSQSGRASHVRWGAGLALLGLLWAWPAAASAQRLEQECDARAVEEAKRYQQQADRLAGEGKRDEALREIDLAYRICPNPVLLLNRGELYEALGQLPEAVFSYRQYLVRRPQGKAASKSNQAITRLEKLLARTHGRLVLQTLPDGATVRIGGGEALALETPLRHWLPPGDHVLGITKDGFRPAVQSVTLQVGQTAKIEIVLQAETPVSALPPGAPHPPVAVPATPLPVPPAPPEPRALPDPLPGGPATGPAAAGFRPAPPLPTGPTAPPTALGDRGVPLWVPATLGVAGFGAGVGSVLLFLAANDREEEGNDIAVGPFTERAELETAEKEVTAKYDDAATDRYLGLGAGILGAAAIGTAIYLLLAGDDDPSSPDATAPGPTSARRTAWTFVATPAPGGGILGLHMPW